MFESGAIITGGKRRSDINATYASRDGAITPSRSVVAARESLSRVFRGSLEAYSPGARSQVSRRSDILRRRIPRYQLPLTCTISHSQGLTLYQEICLIIHPNPYKYKIYLTPTLPALMLCPFRVASSLLETAVESLRFERHLRLLFFLMPPLYLEALQLHHC